MALNRRQLLKAALAASVTGFPSLALADAPGEKRFVFVFLRFGLDGLHAVIPRGDPDYARARGPLALPTDDLVDLDGMFALHPALERLQSFWDDRELAIIHATGQEYRKRSHFECQDTLENGTATPHSTADGWLGRALASLGSAPEAVAIGGDLPLVLKGATHASSVDPTRGDLDSDAFAEAVADLWSDDPLLEDALKSGLAARHEAEMALDGEEMMSDDKKDYGAAAEAAGKLLGAADGPRVGVLSIGGWDSHQNEGKLDGGLAPRLESLASGLHRLRDGLGESWKHTVVVAMSEFGRTVKGNGTGGSDHGTGGVTFVLGGAVAGKQALGSWPGLRDDQLFEGRDLMPTTDARSIFKAILRDHLGVSEGALEDAVFPASRSAAPLGGLLRG